MKKHFILIISAFIYGCISLPPSVENIRANPGGKVGIDSPLNSEQLYKMLSDQARACFGSQYWFVNADYYPDKTASISLRMHSATINGIIWNADLKPYGRPGTHVDFYYYTKEPDGFSRPVIGWIQNGPPMRCP